MWPMGLLLNQVLVMWMFFKLQKEELKKISLSNGSTKMRYLFRQVQQTKSKK